MFLDGITYSAISKNMANGYGSFFNPHYTKVLYSNFYEHPPMVFIIQSGFFRIFGDAFYTERIFSLAITILTAIGITLCWRQLIDKDEFKEYGWLPVLLWLSIPLIFWSYRNNLLENTMGVFTIFAVLFILKALIDTRIIYLFIGSILILMAVLSKGLVGLFPLAVPVLYALVYKIDKGTMLYFMYLVVFTISAGFIVLFIFPELKNNITLYFEQQLIPALNNKREITTNNRYVILLDLLLELSLPAAILIFVMIKKWMKKRSFDFLLSKEAFAFLLIAIAASIPIIVSLKQRKFYLIPSIPFYVLAISFLVVPFIKASLDMLSDATLTGIKRISLVTLVVVILFSINRFGKFSRDKEELTDIYTISQELPAGTILSTTKDLSKDWSLVAYMSRVGYLSLDCDNEHTYYLMEKNHKLEKKVLEKYQIMELDLEKYRVFKIIPEFDK